MEFARRCDRVLHLSRGGLIPGEPDVSQPGTRPEYL
jgi:hypothetical protein